MRFGVGFPRCGSPERERSGEVEPAMSGPTPFAPASPLRRVKRFAYECQCFFPVFRSGARIQRLQSFFDSGMKRVEPAGTRSWS